MKTLNLICFVSSMNFGYILAAPIPNDFGLIVDNENKNGTVKEKQQLILEIRKSLLMKGWQFNRRSWNISYEWDGVLSKLLRTAREPVLYGQQRDMIYLHLESIGYIKIHREGGLRVVGNAKKRISEKDVDLIVQHIEKIIFDNTLNGVEAARP